MQRINYRIEFVADDVQETKVSFRVQQIVAALDKEAPMEQVHQDIAKIISPLICKELKNKQNISRRNESIKNK